MDLGNRLVELGYCPCYLQAVWATASYLITLRAIFHSLKIPNTFTLWRLFVENTYQESILVPMCLPQQAWHTWRLLPFSIIIMQIKWGHIVRTHKKIFQTQSGLEGMESGVLITFQKIDPWVDRQQKLDLLGYSHKGRDIKSQEEGSG